MNLSFLKRLIALVESSNIEELEVSRWGTRVRITKSPANRKTAEAERPVVAEAVAHAEPAAPHAPAVPAGPGAPAAAAAAPAAAMPGPGENLAEIKSPMVGIFYRSPSPGAKPYVEEGERLERG
jgi:biotin carboxyl carrier protein